MKKKQYLTSLFLSFFLLFLIASCTKEQGCTNNNAINYSSNAEENDGSCLFAYDLAQGTWGITASCEDIDILNQTISIGDQLPDSIEVLGSGNNILYINISGNEISGEIDKNGNIIVNNQSIQFDIGLGIPLPISVYGNGQINNSSFGNMIITYVIDNPFGNPEELSCNIFMQK